MTGPIASGPPARPEEDATSAKWGAPLAIVVVSAAVFLAALDQTMVVTVLPAMMRTLHIPYTQLDDAAWIITGYLLGYTVAMPLFGRIADTRGRRLMFVVALALFSIASILCALAPNLQTLVAARIVQAGGGGALVPIAMVIAVSALPGRKALALGIVGAAAEAGGVLGPLYGATLSQLWGWRSIFLVNVPLGAAFIAAAVVLLPRDRRGEQAKSRIDYLGTLLIALSLASLTIGLAGDTHTGQVAVRPTWLIISAVAFVLFLIAERRVREPLVRLSLFRKIPFSAANIANLAVGGALIIAMVEIPLYAYSILGASEIEGGLLLMRLTMMIPIGALGGGWVADRLGYRLTGALGFVLTGVGFLLISSWPIEPSSAVMTRDLILTGLGFGVVIAPIGASVIASVGPEWVTTGSALVTVMRMVGMTVGLSTLSSWGLRRFNGLMADTPLPLRTADLTTEQYDSLITAYERTLNASLHTVYGEFFLVAAGIALFAVLPALLFYRGRTKTAGLPFLPQ